MDLINLLRSVEMFAGLSNEQLEKLAAVFEIRTLKDGEILFRQGDAGDSLHLIQAGFVGIVLEESKDAEERTIVNLGPGQSVGEMALIDQGPRSATVRADTENTVVASVTREAFERLCSQNTDIGYVVMRNIAADLSFRLRRRDL